MYPTFLSYQTGSATIPILVLNEKLANADFQTSRLKISINDDNYVNILLAL